MKNKVSWNSSLTLVSSFLCGLALLVAIPFIGPVSKTKATEQDKQHSDVADLPVRVAIRNQPDSPLTVTLASKSLARTKTLQADFVITNVSKKAIRAYALRYDNLVGNEPYSGLDVSIKSSKKSVVLPRHSEVVTIEGETYTDYLESMRVSVDFVEFSDGTTWGQDSYRTAERLDGQRTGAKEAQKLLLQMIRVGGQASFMSLMESDRLDIPRPADKSEKWLEGFQSGINLIRARVRNLPIKGDLKAIEEVLNMPIDASEGR